MFGRLVRSHSLVSAVISDELLDFHPGDRELNGPSSHAETLKFGRVPGIENGSGVYGSVPGIQHSQDLSFNLGFTLVALTSRVSGYGFI
jgi:hypothetical protein